MNAALTAAFRDLYGDEETAEDGAKDGAKDGAALEDRPGLGLMAPKALKGAGGVSAAGAAGKGSARGVELVVASSPLAATEEVLALFAGDLADFKAAAPVALASIGLEPLQIQEALKRREKREAEEKAEKNRLEKEAKDARAQHDSGGSKSSSGSSGGAGGSGASGSSGSHQSASISVQMVPPAGVPAQPAAAAPRK